MINHRQSEQYKLVSLKVRGTLQRRLKYSGEQRPSFYKVLSFIICAHILCASWTADCYTPKLEVYQQRLGKPPLTNTFVAITHTVILSSNVISGFYSQSMFRRQLVVGCQEYFSQPYFCMFVPDGVHERSHSQVPRYRNGFTYDTTSVSQETEEARYASGLCLLLDSVPFVF